MAAGIFVAGTGQHSGKTLVSLGLVAALTSRGYRVHYMKPVGQRAVRMGSDLVDEDVALINEVYNLTTPPKAGNPITIPSGYTRRFLMGSAQTEPLMDEIRDSYEIIAGDADIVIIEGTGHAGVGSVIGLGNAEVARMLGAGVIVVTSAGIGAAIDEFALNRASFESRGVPILGVLVNKAREEKIPELAPPLQRWFRREEVPLLGIIPYRPMLATITLRQIVAEIGAEVISGHEHLNEAIRECLIGAGSPHRLIDLFQPGILVIMPGDRDDLLLAAFSSYCGVSDEPRRGAAVCLTSGLLPSENVLSIIRASQMPVIASDEGTFKLTSEISDLVAKLTPHDETKLRVAEELVGNHIDIGIIEQVISSG